MGANIIEVGSFGRGIHQAGGFSPDKKEAFARYLAKRGLTINEFMEDFVGCGWMDVICEIVVQLHLEDDLFKALCLAMDRKTQETVEARQPSH